MTTTAYANTTITLCPACGAVLFTEEPPAPIFDGPELVGFTWPNHEEQERMVVEHYVFHHPLRWWIASRWPRVLKWALTLRVHV